MKKILEKLIEEFFSINPNLFLVDFSMDSLNKIIITIDGDNGVKIIHCVSLTKFLKKHLNEELEDFSVEVSSAGLLSPLVSQRQFIKETGIKRTEYARKESRKSISLEDFKDMQVECKLRQ